MNRLTIVLVILGIGLALLIFNHDSGRTFGIDNDDFGRLVMLSTFGTLLGAGILAGRRQFGETARQLGIWLLIVLALVAAYLYRTDLQSFGSRMTAGLIPGRPTVITDSEGQQEVVLHKVLNGHFETTASIDGISIAMLVDTGASSVALTYDDAMRIGLDPAALTFSTPVMTANGQAMAAPVTLNQVAIGPIIRNNVRATVAEDGKLDKSLLGMSFLSTLGFLQMQTDELRLRN
ncbi:TIGR02281 family clan AA aspartic protease [Pararhizobium sp.]|uniref:TIGR02281 family clan AA aspartic protease n=1 Tax=Pararhizobium sp. TaxID=1977563 RepID=UPI002725B4F9|nr:TIGR02281 family clan AA aspartic protease [Pararhizobium sp.]MDO9418989.1 TIGR02281 family clan AA aspartic protease [Pararhizobium sp.]